jgi:hypothetical protein
MSVTRVIRYVTKLECAGPGRTLFGALQAWDGHRLRVQWRPCRTRAHPWHE